MYSPLIPPAPYISLNPRNVPLGSYTTPCFTAMRYSSCIRILLYSNALVPMLSITPDEALSSSRSATARADKRSNVPSQES